jgi:hypothetical protein
MMSIAEQYFFPELEESYSGPRPIAPFDPEAPEFAFALLDNALVLETVLQPSLARLAAERFPDDPSFADNALEIAKIMALASSMCTGPFDIVRWMTQNIPRKYFKHGDSDYNMFALSVGVFAFMVVGTVSHGHGFIYPGGYAANFRSIFRFSNTTSDFHDQGQNIICVVAMMMANMSVHWPTGQTRRMWAELQAIEGVPRSWWPRLA